MSETKQLIALQQRVEQTIRTVPDFPIDGIQFKDITPVFQNPELCKSIINYFVDQAKGEVDCVCGIESRGFLFGFPIALELGVPFYLIRKKGKLPPPTTSIHYDLEYGQAELEIIEGQLQPGTRVMIHDDVLATGGTANACMQLVQSEGATLAQFTFLLELDELKGRQNLLPKDVISLVHIN